MTALDRLSAHQVCPQWYHRVRELNTATTTSLTIAIVDYTESSGGKKWLENIQRIINKSSIGWVFADCLMTADSHHHHHAADLSDDTSPLPSSFSRQWHRLTPWNTLALTEEELNSATLRKQLTTAFADLTALTFVRPLFKMGAIAQLWAPQNRQSHLLTYLGQLLWGAKRWRLQLRHLSLFGGVQKEEGFLDDDAHVEALFSELINARPPALPALRYLTLENLKLPEDLPVLAQLKEITVGRSSCCDLDSGKAFLRSVRRYGTKRERDGNRTAAAAAVLKVNFFNGEDVLSELLLHGHLRRGITRLSSRSLFLRAPLRLTDIVTRFPGLTSLTLTVSPTKLARLFPLMAQQLPHLAHLRLEDWSFARRYVNVLPPLSASLSSMKLFELNVRKFTSSSSFSSDLNWFNLPATMPALQAISFSALRCPQCNCCNFFRSYRWYYHAGTEAQPLCYRLALDVLELLHATTGLPFSRLLYQSEDSHLSAEQYLALTLGQIEPPQQPDDDDNGYWL